MHSTGSDCFYLTLEKECGLSYLQVLKIALRDFTRPINFELIYPGGSQGEICCGPFQVRLFDFDFSVVPYGVESFSLFDRLSDVINRICLKHFNRLIDMTLTCNGQQCDLGQPLGTTIDTHCYRISPVAIDPLSGASPNRSLEQTGCVVFEGSLQAQSSFQEVVNAILPCGDKIK